MANVVTIEELREFKQLKAMLPAVVAAAEGLQIMMQATNCAE